MRVSSLSGNRPVSVHELEGQSLTTQPVNFLNLLNAELVMRFR